MDFSGFHIIAVISNPVNYESRYNLYEIFQEDIERKGGTLWTLEMATGARPHRITKHDCERHIQLWSSAIPGELWHKENLINVAMQFVTRHAPNWRYVAWVDADVKFEAGALEKTVHALQNFSLVQMWSHAVDLGPDGTQVGKTHESFMYCYWHGKEVTNQQGYLQGGHPGFAFAARRDTLNKLGSAITGPLIDFGVLGSGDRHMCAALIGKVEMSVHPEMHPNYHKWLNIWQAEAEKNIKRNVSYVPNTIRHLWHGRKADRGYASRWKILVDNQFDPELDLAKDVSGLWRLTDHNPKLRDDIRKYFRARKEDATTI